MYFLSSYWYTVFRGTMNQSSKIRKNRYFAAFEAKKKLRKNGIFTTLPKPTEARNINRVKEIKNHAKIEII